MFAAPTLVANVFRGGLFFFPFWTANTSGGAWSNSLVPPTIVAYDWLVLAGGARGAPLDWGARLALLAGGCGCLATTMGGAVISAGGCLTLCDRSRRLDWIWFSSSVWSDPWRKEWAMGDSRSQVCSRNASTAKPVADTVWRMEQRRGTMVASPMVRLSTPFTE